MTPTLSVCIPAWNAEHTLRRTVDSVLKQPAWDPDRVEVVVVDDCSKDGTGALLDALQARPGLRCYRNPTNLGATGNWQRALGLGRGDIVTLLHCDDWWMPGLLEAATGAFERDPALVMYACGQLYERDDGVIENRNPEWSGRQWRAPEYLDELLTLRECPAPSVAFFRRHALAQVTPLYDPRFRWSPEREFYVRLMLANPGGTVVNDARPLIRRGIRAEQQSVRYPGHAILDTCALFDVHRGLYLDAARRARADLEARRLFTSFLLAATLRREWKQVRDVARDPAFRQWSARPGNLLGLAAGLARRSARRLLRELGAQ